MCLTTSQTRPVTAEKPIKCYKVVQKSVDADGKPRYSAYFAYSDAEYRIGETFKDTNPFTRSLLNSIERGLHTFSPDGNGARSLYEYAIKRRDYFRREEKKSFFPSEKDFFRSCAYDVALLECEIPAGAEYYEGHCNCLTYYGYEELDQSGYVSDKLTPIRELSRDEIAQMPYVTVDYECPFSPARSVRRKNP